MKHGLQWLLTMTMMLLWSGFCLAQGDAGAVATPTPATIPPLPLADWLGMLILALGGVKGMGALGIAAAVSQLLLKGLKTAWLSKLAGKYKLLLVTALTVVSGVTGLMLASDMSLMAALMHSTTLAAFQVFIHQIWKQFVTKKDNAPE